MRATGIVRRIDDLGRVVIPKEIRKTLRIREGDPLEIFTAKDGEVILKKYSPIGELNEFSQEYAETLGETLGYGVIITDLDSIISVSKLPKKDYKEKYKEKYQKKYQEKLKLEGKLTKKDEISQRRQKIKALLEQGFKQKDICLQLNISKRNCIRDIKYLKEQGLL